MFPNLKEVLQTIIFNKHYNLLFKYTFITENNVINKAEYTLLTTKLNFSILNKKKTITIPKIFISNNEIAFFKTDYDKILSDLASSKNKLNEYKKLFQENENKMEIKAIKSKIQHLNDFFQEMEKKENKLKKQLEKNTTNKNLSDIKNLKYEDLFPQARSMKRKIKFFIGPTNSGKTYNAINELVSHKSGVYLAPLRLLALEGQDEIKQRGFPCSFITGEEKEIIPDAKFIAQTVETFNFHKEVDAILIDEIQMLNDPNRGWAWTQALIGAPSKNIILTGSLDSLSVIQFIAQLLNDDLEIINLNRFTQLTCIETPINLEKSINNLEPGTAIITFSRKNVLHIKSLFEFAKIPVSIIYGNLSPEVRREEARKFREGETQFLISTDAIAMGLNLPIKMVIFAEVSKFNGIEVSGLSAPEIRQIGGRAGRFNKYPEGFFTGTTPQDIQYLKKGMNTFNMMPNEVYIKPTLDQVLQISERIQSSNLLKILNTFKKMIDQNNIKHYLSFDVDALKPALLIIDQFDFTLEEKMFFLEIPLDYKNDTIMNYFNNWLIAYAKKEQISPKLFFPYNQEKYNNDNLLAAENNIKLITAYLWMANHLPDLAPHKDTAISLKMQNNTYIIKCLGQSLDSGKKCEICQIQLPLNFIHKRCDSCFNNFY